MIAASAVDWSKPHCPVSRHFTVREAIWLPQWGRLATEADGLDDHAKAALLALFVVLDLVRDFLNIPLLVHVAFRPKLYNEQIGGAPSSCHMARKEALRGAEYFLAAVDFSGVLDAAEDAGANCDMIRELLAPKLAEFGLRMEDNGKGAAWVHLDNHPVFDGHSRYFLR